MSICVCFVTFLFFTLFCAHTPCVKTATLSPMASPFKIRLATADDSAALLEVCLKTGNHGDDGTEMYPEDPDALGTVDMHAEMCCCALLCVCFSVRVRCVVRAHVVYAAFTTDEAVGLGSGLAI